MDSDEEQSPRIAELQGRLNRIREIQRRISSGQPATDEETELCRSSDQVLSELRALLSVDAPANDEGQKMKVDMISFPVIGGNKKERLVLSRISKELAPRTSPRNVEKDEAVLRRESQLEESGFTSKELERIATFLTDAEKQGVIEPCPADDQVWSAGIYVAKDLTGSEGIYFDFSSLRGTIPESTMPIPLESSLAPLPSPNHKTTEIHSELRLATYEAAWPIPLAQSDRPKTAFQPPFPSSSPYGKRYRFKVAPTDMPGTNAAIQNILAEAVFDGLVVTVYQPGTDVIIPNDAPNKDGKGDLVTVRLDRIVVRGGESFENHIRLLSEVLNRIKVAGLCLAKDKCKFGCLPDGTSANLPLGERRALEALVNSAVAGR
ncbi:hypothetical protein HDU67_007391 [Dinochytrium kinnereticum]|nr:hypothetical protein HDU67_007391 [Dinochytrium kinnereticum]